MEKKKKNPGFLEAHIYVEGFFFLPVKITGKICQMF